MGRQVHAGEAQEVRVLRYKNKRDDAGPAMSGVEPIAGPRVIGDVALALIPDPKAVEAVVGDRDPDEEQLQQKNERQAVQKLDLLAISRWAFEGLGVRDEVFEKESSDGYDAAQGMQTAQQERGTLASAQWSDAGLDHGSDGIGS